MRPLSRLAFVELKLLFREPFALVFIFGLPAVELVIFGFAYRQAIGFLASLLVSMPVAMTGMYTLPTALAGYRERGVLRRLSTTPVAPAALLAAQLLVTLLLAVVAVAMMMGIGGAVFHLGAPRNLSGFLAAFGLGAMALFSIGLLVAAVAPTGRVASGLGPLCLWVCLFLAGGLLPKDVMPGWLVRVGDLTPLGALQDMLQAAWAGASPAPIELGAAALTAAAACTLAARMFRWD